MGVLHKKHLSDIDLKDYFELLQRQDFNVLDLDSLTELFTEKEFYDKKPYLFRRQIEPFDSRFGLIEIVFDETKKIKAICWDLNLKYNDLLEYFGKPILNYSDYSECTEFAFLTFNKTIEIIITRIPGKYTEVENGVRLKNEITEKIENPDFSFIQFSLK